MGPRRPGHSLNKQPGVNHISAMAQSEGGHHHHSSKPKTKSIEKRKRCLGYKDENIIWDYDIIQKLC